MKNLPEKIYLQIGEEADIDDNFDFNELVGVSWCSDKIEESDVEFVRSDIAMNVAKEFAEFIRYNTKPIGGGKYMANKKYLTEADKVYSLDELFTEYESSRKAKQEEK